MCSRERLNVLDQWKTEIIPSGKGQASADKRNSLMKKCSCTHASIQRIIDTTVSLALLLPNPQVSECAAPACGHSDACKRLLPHPPTPTFVLFIPT